MTERRCARCGGPMEGRPANAKYCGSECAKDAERERRRERQRRRRRDPEWRARRNARRRLARADQLGERVCLDCGASIADRGPRSKRCRKCQRKRKRALEREAYRERAGIAGDRRCENCGRSITHRHGRAKYCERCAKLRRTTRGRRYMRHRRRTDPGFRQRKRKRWPCWKHVDELLRRQHGRCGICREAIGAPDTWAVNRIRPEAEGGRWEKENCQVVHRRCASAKGARWEGSMEAQVERWAPWKLNPGTE